MAISDTQKVDYLWKKLGYSATKTDTNALKKAPNEAISSPLLMRIDTLWSQSGSIPGVLPGSSTGVVTVYPTSNPIECTEDATSTANRTWKTGQTNWISPEFGSTYQVKVYIHTASDAAGATGGDQVFATGSGNDDEWFFDYQSGVLHFIGTNLPNGVSFTGKSVYISGGRYTGSIGGNFSASTMGDLTTIGSPQTTLTPIVTNADIGLDPTGTGQVVITGTNAITIPSGSTAARPSGSTGDLRVNTATGNLEYYASGQWNALDPSAGTATALDSFTGDGSTTTFTLSAESSTDSVIVTIQGVVQKATTAYTVSGTTLTFSEAPLLNEQIEARVVSTTYTLGDKVEDSDGDTFIRVEESTDEDTIRFDTAGTQRMVITNTGNVGIGVDTPSTALHVAGIITANSIDADFTGSIFADDSSLLVDGTTGSINLNGTVKGHIIPDDDETYDLGSSGAKFRDLYLSGSSIKLGTETITSTTGKIIFSGAIQSSGRFDGDVTGSVFADDSSLLVDGVNGTIIGDVDATTVDAVTLKIGGTSITATAAELNALDGITATVTELNYTDGVTSNIQTQLDAKAPLAGPAFTGTATGVNLTLSGNLTVNGTTVTNSATNTTIEDALIELGSGNAGANSNDLGLILERGSTGDNAFIGWDESADKFIVGTTTATGASTGDLTITAGTLVASTFEGDLTGDVTGNASTATTLQTARTIGGVSFNGSANIDLPGVNTSGDQDTSGNAATATEATNVTVTANNTTNETTYIAFVDGATGTQGIETDTGLSYNPSTNTLTTTTFSGQATSAQYADLAEKYLCDQDYDEGTVVMVGGTAEVTACTEYAYAIGVVSKRPALMMNSELEGGTYIALKGRVPVKVQGPITKGQTLVAGDNGVAQEGTQGRVFGIALETTNSSKIVLIQAVIL